MAVRTAFRILRSRGRFVLLGLLVGFSSGCTASRSALPLRFEAGPEAESTTAMIGQAEAYLWGKGEWQRHPTYDYDFIVVERRWGARIETIKEMHRRHPGYDGLGGPRDQSLFFELSVRPGAGGIELEATSTLGAGHGVADAGWSRMRLELRIEKAGFFMPYDRYRITQDRDAERGGVRETVELYSIEKGREVPFMKMEERAILFLPKTGLDGDFPPRTEGASPM